MENAWIHHKKKWDLATKKQIYKKDGGEKLLKKWVFLKWKALKNYLHYISYF